jgi:hypothetical protein
VTHSTYTTTKKVRECPKLGMPERKLDMNAITIPDKSVDPATRLATPGQHHLLRDLILHTLDGLAYTESLTYRHAKFLEKASANLKNRVLTEILRSEKELTPRGTFLPPIWKTHEFMPMGMREIIAMLQAKGYLTPGMLQCLTDGKRLEDPSSITIPTTFQLVRLKLMKDLGVGVHQESVSLVLDDEKLDMLSWRRLASGRLAKLPLDIALLIDTLYPYGVFGGPDILVATDPIAPTKTGSDAKGVYLWYVPEFAMFPGDLHGICPGGVIREDTRMIFQYIPDEVPTETQAS